MGGIADFLGGIGKILGKIPIQGRKERWKNELEALQQERKELLRGEPNTKKANRVWAIDERINHLNGLLKNSSSDD